MSMKSPFRSYVSIEKLQVLARIGVDPVEREVGNLFEVDMTVEYDITEAAEADDVEKALNYAELTEIVLAILKKPCKLIETAACDIHRAVVERWPAITSGTLSITKLHPPIPAPTPRAKVSIEWGRD